MGDFARWSKTVRIDLFDEKWERMPATTGVYVIKISRSISRIGGVDRAGVLYVGRASWLRSRVWRFMNGDHQASAFLWMHLDIARIMLDNRLRTVADIEKRLR